MKNFRLLCTLLAVLLFTGCTQLGGDVREDVDTATAEKIELADQVREANTFLYTKQATALYRSLATSYRKGLMSTSAYRQQLIIMDGIDGGIAAYANGSSNTLGAITAKMSAVHGFLLKHGAENIDLIPGILDQL